MLYFDVNCATEVKMQLWWQWWSLVAPLRAACTRQRSFLWLASALAGYSARADLLGVTSIVRTLGLAARCYDRLLDFFHSPAVDIESLTRCWVQQVLQTLPVQRFAGRPVLLGDGIKVAKAGRRMPAVKLLHQPGESNTKPPYIMGHSIQVISVLVGAADSHLAVPLVGRIHEGVKFTNRDHRTLPGKCCDLLDSLGLEEPFYFVADAYYGCKTVALRLRGSASHLISRVRRSAVAYLPAPAPAGRRKRGRPRLYGRRIKLWTLFDSDKETWQSAESPVYGERGVTIRFLSRDLIWRPVRALMRFVLVDHPTRGRSIFITTDLSLPPIEVIRLYGLRFKIELSFKQSLRVLGHLRLPFLAAGHAEDLARFRHPTPASCQRPVSKRRATQTRCLPPPYPGRPDRSGPPAVPRHPTSAPRLVLLRVLAAHHPPRYRPLGARHRRSVAPLPS